MGLVTWLKSTLTASQKSRAIVPDLIDLAVPGSWPHTKPATVTEISEDNVGSVKHVAEIFEPPRRLDTSTSTGLSLDAAKAAAATSIRASKPAYGTKYDRRGVHGYRAATAGVRPRKQVGAAQPAIESAKEMRMKRKAHDDVPTGPETKKVRFVEGHTEMSDTGVQQSLILKQLDSISKKRDADNMLDTTPRKRQRVVQRDRKQAPLPVAENKLTFRQWQKNQGIATDRMRKGIAKVKKPEVIRPGPFHGFGAEYDKQLEAFRAAEAKSAALQAQLMSTKAELSSRDEAWEAKSAALQAQATATKAELLSRDEGLEVKSAALQAQLTATKAELSSRDKALEARLTALQPQLTSTQAELLLRNEALGTMHQELCKAISEAAEKSVNAEVMHAGAPAGHVTITSLNKGTASMIEKQEPVEHDATVQESLDGRNSQPSAPSSQSGGHSLEDAARGLNGHESSAGQDARRESFNERKLQLEHQLSQTDDQTMPGEAAPEGEEQELNGDAGAEQTGFGLQLNRHHNTVLGAADSFVPEQTSHFAGHRTQINTSPVNAGPPRFAPPLTTLLSQAPPKILPPASVGHSERTPTIRNRAGQRLLNELAHELHWNEIERKQKARRGAFKRSSLTSEPGDPMEWNWSSSTAPGVLPEPRRQPRRPVSNPSLSKPPTEPKAMRINKASPPVRPNKRRARKSHLSSKLNNLGDPFMKDISPEPMILDNEDEDMADDEYQPPRLTAPGLSRSMREVDLLSSEMNKYDEQADRDSLEDERARNNARRSRMNNRRRGDSEREVRRGLRQDHNDDFPIRVAARSFHGNRSHVGRWIDDDFEAGGKYGYM